MNEEEEATWLVIHAKICKLLPMRVLKSKMLLLDGSELELLREQMPKLLKVNQ